MRYTPFESFDRMFDSMYSDMRRGMFDRPYDGTGAESWRGDGAGWPAYGTHMDLAEHEDELVFTADLPGFETDEIDLRLDGGHLILSASHESSDGDSSRHRTIRERVALPVEVDEDGIGASYHNGVLEVHLPVVEDHPDAGHRIDID